MRRVLGLLVPFSLVLGLAACGGGSGSSDSSSKSSDSSSSGSKGDDEFSKLIEKGNNAKLKVTYKTADGSSYTIVQDPPKRAFISGDTAIYEDGSDTSTLCSNVGKPDVTCMKLPESGGLAGLGGAGSLGVLAQILQSSKNLPGVKATADRTIAGRSAKCAKYSVPFLGNGSIESCVDKETGITLYIKTTGEGTTSLDLEATEVTQPKASDFTPPAKAQDINEFMPTTPTS